MTKRVRDLISRKPIELDDGTPIVEAARQMRVANVGAVIVSRGGKLMGIVTDRDITIRAVAQGKDPRTTKLAEICSSGPMTLSPDDDVDRALQIMRERAVRRVPVVDSSQRAIGMLSLGDLARDRDPHSVLGQISAALPQV